MLRRVVGLNKSIRCQYTNLSYQFAKTAQPIFHQYSTSLAKTPQITNIGKSLLPKVSVVKDSSVELNKSAEYREARAELLLAKLQQLQNDLFVTGKQDESLDTLITKYKDYVAEQEYETDSWFVLENFNTDESIRQHAKLPDYFESGFYNNFRISDIVRRYIKSLGYYINVDYWPESDYWSNQIRIY